MISTTAGRRIQAARHPQHLQAGGAGQVLVGQHQIEAALPHQIDRLLARGGGGDAVAAPAQGLAQHRQHHRLVVDHQHLVAGGDEGAARGGGVGDQPGVDVARGGGRQRAIGRVVQRPEAGQRLDQPAPGHLGPAAQRPCRPPPGPAAAAGRAPGRPAPRRTARPAAARAWAPRPPAPRAAPRRAAARLAQARVQDVGRRPRATTSHVGRGLHRAAAGDPHQIGVAHHHHRRLVVGVAGDLRQRLGQRRFDLAPAPRRAAARALRSSSPRVRARRHDASQRRCARNRASLSGSGRGTTAAASPANASPQRMGSAAIRNTRSLNGRSSLPADSAFQLRPSSRSSTASSNGSAARRSSAARVDGSCEHLPLGRQRGGHALRARARARGPTRYRSSP